MSRPSTTDAENTPGHQMATISILDDDVEPLVDGLADIHEMHELDLRDGPDLWYALANLVGALRDQKTATGTGAPVGVRNRIDLEPIAPKQI